MNFQPQVGNTLNGPYRSWYLPPGALYSGNRGYSVVMAGPPPNVSYGYGMVNSPYYYQRQPQYAYGTGGPNVTVNVNGGTAMPYYGPYALGYYQKMAYGPYVFQAPGGGQRGITPVGPGAVYYPGSYAGATGSQHLGNLIQRNANDKPQDIHPSDPDKSRMYQVREVDGHWTQRNLMTIDSGDIGAVRWYQRTDGTFYAQRLPGG